MARRSQRQLIRDRLSSAVKACDRIDGCLQEVEAMYLDAGEARGMELRQIAGMVQVLRQTLTDWRRERT